MVEKEVTEVMDGRDGGDRVEDKDGRDRWRHWRLEMEVIGCWRNSPSAGDEEEEEEESGGGGAKEREGEASPSETPDWMSAELGAGLEVVGVVVGTFDCRDESAGLEGE